MEDDQELLKAESFEWTREEEYSPDDAASNTTEYSEAQRHQALDNNESTKPKPRKIRSSWRVSRITVLDCIQCHNTDAPTITLVDKTVSWVLVGISNDCHLPKTPSDNVQLEQFLTALESPVLQAVLAKFAMDWSRYKPILYHQPD